MRLIRFAVLGSLPALLAGIALAFALGGRPASAANEAMAVDCDASSEAVDAVCYYGPNATFQISVHATNAGEGYVAYQVKPRWTDATLHYAATADPANENQWPVFCFPTRVDNQPGDPSVLFGCTSFPVVTSTYTGPLARFDMQCQTPGTTTIQLVLSADDPGGFGTEFYSALGAAIVPAITNATVRCLAEGETPMPSPSQTPDGPTATPVTTEGPSPTPGTGTPTATPTPTLQPGVTPTVTPTAMGTTPTSTPSGGLKGDANGDGNTNSIDAAIVLQYTAGLVGSLPDQANADTNHSGAVDSVDAALILQIDAGLLPQPA